LRQRQAEFDAHDAVLLVVGFEAERRVGGYCRRYKLPGPCLVDADRTVYRAYGMGQAGWRETFTLRTLAPYVRQLISGKIVRSGADQDVRQRGGDFVIGRDGCLTLAYVSDDPADRPSVDTMMAAVR
jgi:hypothetical protein